MVKCATSWSSPPKVCTNCFDQYIEFKQMEYFTHHLDNVTSLDNTTCTKVIYANYLLSYVYEISNALTKRVWDTSRCDGRFRGSFILHGIVIEFWAFACFRNLPKSRFHRKACTYSESCPCL